MTDPLRAAAEKMCATVEASLLHRGTSHAPCDVCDRARNLRAALAAARPAGMPLLAIDNLAATALAADTARPGLDVEALADAICASQEHCDGTCPGVEGVDAIHRHEALSIAGEYARLTEARP